MPTSSHSPIHPSGCWWGSCPATIRPSNRQNNNNNNNNNSSSNNNNNSSSNNNNNNHNTDVFRSSWQHPVITHFNCYTHSTFSHYFVSFPLFPSHPPRTTLRVAWSTHGWFRDSVIRSSSSSASSKLLQSSELTALKKGPTSITVTWPFYQQSTKKCSQNIPLPKIHSCNSTSNNLKKNISNSIQKDHPPISHC